jgi:hypothetical protein
MRYLAALILLAGPASLSAAEKRVGLSSFDRVRITGPIEARIVPGSPAATLSGDPKTMERVELRVEGTTLNLRLTGPGWNLRGGDDAKVSRVGPVTVTLSTPRLSGVAVFAGTRLTAARMAGERVDLSVSGAGAITVDQVVSADQLSATVIGAGELVLAGKARRVRLTTNGPGRIDAGALAADELSVRLDGTGETLARARYRAQVSNTGIGTVSVAGAPKCEVLAPAGGTVTCGAAR